MIIVRPWEVKGHVRDKGGPTERLLKVVLSPRTDAGVEHLAVGVVVLPPGSRSGMHGHPTPESWYVISGRGLMQIGDEVCPVEPGVVIHGPAGVDHQFINTGDEDLKALFIFAPPGEEQAILDEMDRTPAS